jgi:phospholipid/cholesterol/gamma-HCH transport system ATP-binding protein
MLNTEPNTNPKKNTPPVKVESLSKSFGNQTVLKGISLEVAEGETLSILGRSGTGKSVLLKLIIGLHKPDSGSIRVNGEEVTKLPLKELNEVRKKVGFLFQQAALYDSLTIEENIAFPLRRHSKMSDDKRGKRVRELLASVGMDQDAHKLPAERPVECKSASAWRGRWLWIPTSCSLMSLRRGWIRSPRQRSTT